MNKFLIVTFLTTVSSQDFISPCPRIFKYELRNSNEPEKWYGQATLVSESDLSGIWLRLFFDKPALQLGVSYFCFVFQFKIIQISLK